MTTSHGTSATTASAAVEQLFQATIGALELLHVYVGDRLGLYTGLKAVSDATPAELAARTGIAERYAREWLEEQAVAGFVDVTADNRDATLRRYRLPGEIAEVTTDPDSLSYVVPLAPLFVSIAAAYRDAGSPGLAGRYDLVTFFETVHDMADPVASLRAALALLAPGGAVLVADEKVAESFTAPGDELERFNYGWSALHCLPAALTEIGSAGTGTVMRPETLRGYATAAGFASTTVLPIEHDFWRFYRLDP